MPEPKFLYTLLLPIIPAEPETIVKFIYLITFGRGWILRR